MEEIYKNTCQNCQHDCHCDNNICQERNDAIDCGCSNCLCSTKGLGEDGR